MGTSTRANGARGLELACACAIAIAIGLAHAAGAQAVRPYRPAFDVRDYALTIDLPDTGSIIHGDAVISVDRTMRADTLVLDLVGLHVSDVTVDRRAVHFVQDSATIAIPLPHSRRSRESYEVDVVYGGAVTDGLIARVDSAGRWTYFGDNWPNRARHWIPSIDHPSDKATVTWRVRAPMRETVVANGKLMSRTAIGGNRTETVWRETQPIPVYLMVIAAAPLVRYDLGDTDCGMAALERCVEQAVYTAPEQSSFMPGPFQRAPGIIEFFSHIIGPFPYEKLAHLQSSTRFGGMENATAIFYADEPFRNHTMGDGVIAHETAHQWFGDAVTEREWAHLWLSEGFATYMAALWTRASRGDSAFRAEMAGIRATVLEDSVSVTTRPVIDTAQTNYLALLDRNSYQKGGFVLQMLRAQIGEGAFFDGLRDYYKAHRNGTALTSDLRAAMEHTSHQKLDWFFDQWLRRPGYPVVTAYWAYDPAAHDVTIDVLQSARFGTFRFPLTVAVVDSSGAEHRASLEMPAVADLGQRIHVPVSAAPAQIILDPDVELLAVLKVLKR